MSTFVLVTGGYDTSIRFFDATDHTSIRTIQFCDQQVLRLAFSGRGPVATGQPLYLAVAGSPSVRVYDVTTNDTSPSIFAVYGGHSEPVTAVGFEPFHTAFVYSASEDGTLQTWLPELGQHTHPHYLNNPNTPHPMPTDSYRFPSVPARMVNTASGGIGSVAIHDAVYFPPSDMFFTADYNGRLRVWSHATSNLLSSHIPHPSRRNLQCLDLSSDFCTLVLANFDGFVFVYRVSHLLEYPDRAIPLTFRANSSYIPRIRLSDSSNFLVCTSRSGAIKVFRMADVFALSERSEANSPDCTITPHREFVGHPGWIFDVAFVEDREDYFFTCSSNTQVMLWNVNDLQQSNEFTGHEKAVVCIAVRERYDAIAYDEPQLAQDPIPGPVDPPSTHPPNNVPLFSTASPENITGNRLPESGS